MLKNFFSFNSLELQGSYKLHKLIFLTIITGLYYTLFLNNTSAEYVEFAQTLAGMIPINVHNDFYLFRQSDSSLQILLPAILLKMNLSDAFVGTVASFVCQTTAFLAAVLLVYYLTKSTFVSFLSAFIFFKAGPNYHFYPYVYPSAFAAFGTLGMWWAILCLGFFLNNWKKTSLFLSGLLVSIHLVWFAAVLAFFFYASLKKELKWKHLLTFLLGAAISLAGFFTFKYMKKNYFDKSLYTSSHDTKKIDDQISKVPSNSTNPRTIFHGHNPKIITDELVSTFKNLSGLNLFSFYFFLMSFLVLKLRLIESEKIKWILVPYLLTYCATFFMLGIIELNDSFLFSYKLSDLLLRVIPNRFLNLSLAFNLALMIATFLAAYFQTPNKWLKVGIVLLAYNFWKHPFEKLPHFLVILFVLLIITKRYKDFLITRQLWKA